jgi:hypothetical protein
VSSQPLDLDGVRAKIAEEVRRRRAEGSFDASNERELEQLFHQYAPLQGRTGAVGEALRAVDAHAFINPHVPVDSNQPAGAVIKKTMRKAGFWYVEWITSQTTRALSSIARSLHLIDDELTTMRLRLDLISDAGTPVLDVDDVDATTAWWADEAARAVGQADGRTLVSACGTGWFVRRLVAEGVDAYGLDPRTERIMNAEIAGFDLRDEDLIEHLSSVADARLSAIVLTGTTEALLPSQRRHLLGRLETVLAPRASVVVHTIHPDSLRGDELPAELDLAGGRPLRPSSWVSLLEAQGFAASAIASADGKEALIVAMRGHEAPSS